MTNFLKGPSQVETVFIFVTNLFAYIQKRRQIEMLPNTVGVQTVDWIQAYLLIDMFPKTMVFDLIFAQYKH